MVDQRMQDRQPTGAHWLVGGGEMGKLIRSMDWSKTPLGPVASWPQSLRTTVSLCLASNFPISLAWGPKHTQIYNDGYWPLCGGKHPCSMGQDFSECWASAWPAIGEAFERALAGEASFLEDRRMFLDRHGYLEETCFTFSFSPIRDETGGVGGLFHPATETTAKMLSERRTRTLRDLAARAGKARSVEEACTLAAQTLTENELDLPFVLLYLLDADRRQARLVGGTGLAPGTAASPDSADLAAQAGPSWPFAEVLRCGASVRVDGLERRFGPLRCGPYPESPPAALVLPVTPPGVERPLAVLVAGVSSRLPLNEAYRGFYDLLASAVTAAVANARAYQEERRRAEALAELDRAKTAFFSNVSHEFRTPLTLLLGPVEDTLADACEPPTPRQRERLEVAHRSALRLQKLVNTLLDFARIEAGRVQASYQPTDLAALTAGLASNFRSACEKAGLELRVDCPPLPEPVFVDREMWEKVVLNLLSNAFKFTLRGRIEVMLRQSDRHAELHVTDTGVGIPADQMPRLFERFHQIKGTTGRSQEGSGIGLALVRELVRLHGGEVRAESDCGQGTTFAVSIPLGTAHLPAEQIEAPRRLASTALGSAAYVGEALRWLPDPAAGPSPAPQERPSGADVGTGEETLSLPSSPRPRILLADDNADMREYVRRLLAEQYDVTAVADGREALDTARREPPDLVLTDVMMPGLDGFGLLRALRADPRTAELLVVLLSARAGEEARVEGLEAGADDYLTKPFGSKELLARVGAHLELARLRRRTTAAVLRGSQERLRVALAASDTGTFRWEPSTGRFLECDDNLKRLFGLDPGGAVRVTEDFLARVHPDDLPQLAQALDQCRQGADFETAYRVVLPGGGVRWLYGRGKNQRDAGNPAYLVGACTDITKRKRVQEALEEANRRKDEFLAMLAHELRNPLAPLRNALHVLGQRGSADPAFVQSREMMERQVRHLARIVDDLLDVSRIIRGKVQLRPERLDLARLVRTAALDHQDIFRQAGLDLDVDVPELPVWVMGDSIRLAQILSNLLHNAAKFTGSGGRVSVRLAVDTQRGKAEIAVRDTGIGIEPEMLPRLFETFAQADRSLDRSKGGLGLGLSLVKGLVELHGGEVHAASAGPGCGAEFTVRLPAEPEPAALTEMPAAPTPAGKRLRILVVEDNRDAADSLRLLLELYGYEATVAYTGPDGVTAAEAWQPDVVLCDIGLPGLDGFGVARRLRENPSTAKARLVAVTGYGAEEDKQRSREVGFDAHMVKPVDPAALQGVLLQEASA